MQQALRCSECARLVLNLLEVKRLKMATLSNQKSASDDHSTPFDRSRRRALKAGVLSLGSSVFVGGASRFANAQSDSGCDALFVLSGESMSFDGHVLTLKGTHPTVLYFCDRPVREAGHLTLEALSSQVQQGENNFKENPPNAAVSIFSEDGGVREVVIVLPSAPLIDGDQVTFEVAGIEGVLPADGGAVSLFIDPIGVPLSPNSVAGVHRRHRRRAIRRNN